MLVVVFRAERPPPPLPRKAALSRPLSEEEAYSLGEANRPPFPRLPMPKGGPVRSRT